MKACRMPIVVAVLFLMSGGWLFAQSESATFHVAPNGKDRWSGRLESPNTAGTDGPVATLLGARNAIRRVRQRGGKLAGPITVKFAPGEYAVTKTVVFESRDSGTPECPVTYIGAGEGTSVLTGAQPITEWQRPRVGLAWVAPVPKRDGKRWVFRHLFVDGRSAIRARHPNREDYWFTIESLHKPYEKGVAVYRKEDRIAAWPDLAQIELVQFRVWDFSRLRITSVDVRKHEFHVSTQKEPNSFRRWRGDKRYYLENSLRFLDAPGEWYLDTKNERLHLRPPSEAAFAQAKVTAPVVDRLIRFEGTADKPVEHLRFEGLTFAHTDWDYPADGYVGHQADVVAGAAIEGDYVRSSQFRNCLFTGLGRYALWLRKGCVDNVITHCEFTDLGAGAIEIGEDKRGRTGEEGKTERNEIAHNHIHHNGFVWPGACGIWVGPASYTHIHHNHIHDHTYTGISVGFTWSDSVSGAHHNTIEYNHVHDVMMLMGDGGCIYTLGRQDGTVIRNNVLHDVYGWNGQGNGIYTDQGSSGLTIENNLVARTLYGGIGCGTNDNIVRNNIVVHARKCGLGTHLGNRRRWERNIVYLKEGLPIWPNLKGEDNRFDYNLYYHTAQRDMDFPGGYPLDEWQALGQDTHSRVADPLFVDVEKGDFNLRPDSPAIALGFVPFKVPVIGKGSTDPRSSERLSRLFKLRPTTWAPRSLKDAPAITAKPRAGKITIDGKAGEGEWDLASKVTLKQDAYRGVYKTLRSYLCVTYDKEHLYVLIVTPVEDMEKLRAKESQWARDDGAEVCLQNVTGKRSPIYVVQGFASGDVESVAVAGASLRAARLLGEAVEYAAHVGQGQWSGEWKIPFAQCSVDPAKHSTFRFNVGVRRAYQHKWILWVGTGASTWNLENAGKLVLTPK